MCLQWYDALHADCVFVTVILVDDLVGSLVGDCFCSGYVILAGFLVSVHYGLICVLIADN